MYKKYRDLDAAKTFLETDAHGRPSTQRLKICVVTLLWEMAKVDHAISKIEFARMISLIDSEFHVLDRQASELLRAAEYLERERSKLDEFIGEINRAFDPEQRQHLVDMLVEVAKADGMFNVEEKTFATILKEKLNLAPS
jgi:uncharacterized tellurite resistance protein B-like protein